MRICLVATFLAGSSALAQGAGRFPPDSLRNTQVIPHATPVIQVVGQMRNIAAALGVSCVYCHAGTEDTPMEAVDWASDAKRTKLVARQMMRMVQEINHRLDTIPGRPTPGVAVNCATCHRGLPRPMSLANVVAQAAIAVDADSAVRAYQLLRERYFGRDAYDFGEPALNVAAFRVARAGKTDDALMLLALNETLFPNSSEMAVVRGNVFLMRGDTARAASAFREALRRDANNDEARGRLDDIHRPMDAPLTTAERVSAAQRTAATALRIEILAADSALFDAFNRRDVPRMRTFFTRDLEFYQDNEGVENYAQTMKDFATMLSQPTAPRRQLVPGSVEVYPIKGFGAIQSGSHRFCHTENGREDCGTFKFVHVWKKTAGRWQIARVVSFAH